MNFDNLKKTDPLCYDLVLKEINRQETSLELIPSECIASLSVIEALWTPFTNKYSEWYAKKRFYWWNHIVDQVEELAIERAKKAFPWVIHVNVQPYSWSPANLAVYLATCNPWDTIVGQSLPDWWHLTHGWKVSATWIYYNSIQYHVKSDWYIDLEETAKIIRENKPKLVWIWASAYPREFPFEEIGKLADEVWAYVAADIAHISWLVISWVHTNPAPYVDIITTTTHKTMRWPRWWMIMVTEKWLKKDPDLASKIDRAVFPWLQWWPHNHQTLAIAVALWEALKPEFKELNKQIKINANHLAQELKKLWFNLVSWGTENHLILVNVRRWRGVFLQEALDKAWITLNKNTIPQDPATAFNPSWIRMWTPILTMRWMKEKEMEKVAKWIKEVSDEVKDFDYSDDKEERKENLKRFYDFINANSKLKEIRQEIEDLCKEFPIYNYRD